MAVVWTVFWLAWMIAAVWKDRAVKRPALRHHIVYQLLPAIGGPGWR